VSILTDSQIRHALINGDIGIDPYDDALVQPCSIDLTLAPEYRYPTPGLTSIDLDDVPAGHTTLASADPSSPHYLPVPDAPHDQHGLGAIRLLPGQCIIASTRERITLANDMLGMVEGKSSLGRLFLAVHVTAGLVDSGWDGQITLEIVNLSPWTLDLRPGRPICQMTFDRLDEPVAKPYAATGRYQSQIGPTESRYGWNRDKARIDLAQPATTTKAS
jgi:dCTP deaminase